MVFDELDVRHQCSSLMKIFIVITLEIKKVT